MSSQGFEAAALLRVPFDELKEGAREQNKSTVLAALVARLRSDECRGAGRDAPLAEVEAALVQHRAFLSAASSAQTACLARLEARLHHVSSCDGAAWEARRAERLLCDFLHRAGCVEAAAALEAATGGPLLQDGALHLARSEMRRALEGGDPGPALAWCAAHRASLTKAKSTLELRLRLTQLAARVLAGDTRGAVGVAREHAAPLVTPASEPLLLHAMGLLSRRAEAAAMLSPQAWAELSRDLEGEWAATHGLPPVSPLELLLQAGLTALHTQHVDRHAGPLGEAELAELAAPLPWAKHSQTRQRCRLTNALMDEANPPAALPNGRVFSRAALEELAAASNGVLYCPHTGDGPYNIGELRKVFLA